MKTIQEYFWPLLSALLVLFVVTTMVMQRLATRFFTMGKVRQSFTIFDLEFPSKSSELMKILKGIDELPSREEAVNSKRALRAHLTLDFLFMLAIYPLIFLLCWKTSMKMEWTGKWLFKGLAVAQALPLIFDVAENIYLLRKLANPEKSSKGVHRAYLRIVLSKWIIALVGLVCAAFGLLYFWVTGLYSRESLPWIFGLVGGLILIIIVAKVAKRELKPDKASAP